MNLTLQRRIEGAIKFEHYRQPHYRIIHGLKRRIYAPNSGMRIIAKSVLSYLGKLDIELPNATACQQGCSPLNNVLAHEGNHQFYILDLVDAYGAVQAGELNRRLRQLNFVGKYAQSRTTEELEATREYYARGIAMHCCHRPYQCLLQPGLPFDQQPLPFDEGWVWLEENAARALDYNGPYGLVRGCPASPALFNIYCEQVLDRRLRSILPKDMVYTRYVDDLAFSANFEIEPELRRQIRGVVEETGFRVNHRKSKLVNLHGNQSIVITGIGIRDWFPSGLYLPRHQLRTIEGLIHEATKNPEISPAVVYGWMAVFFQLNKVKEPSDYNATEQRLVKRWEAYKAHVRRR